LASLLKDLLASTDLLTSVLTYHVVAGTVTSDMVASGQVPTSMVHPSPFL
jgi:uncharacterized surface protein with fasciclin (FAS1) repeats